MCEACLPACGVCKPAKFIVAICPDCGKGTMKTREECLLYLRRPFKGKTSLDRASVDPRCGYCGGSLGEEIKRKIRPLPCRYSGIVCGYPCGKRTRVCSVDDSVCGFQVPMARLSPEESPIDLVRE